MGSGLGGPVDMGPGSSMTGWTTIGVATGTQGLGPSDTSLSIDIPDIFVPAGQTVGVCLLFVSGAGPRYFGTGTPPLQTFNDANLTLTTGDSRSAPFTTGGSFFSSRGLVGELTYELGGTGGGPGTNYCTANNNSTGVPAAISSLGSASVAANNLALVCSDMPSSSFGDFLTSQSRSTGTTPPGRQGILCLAGAIGRYVGPGQIQNSGATGEFSLQVDLTSHPTPTGLVSVNAGETWNFQCWFRDMDTATGIATSNFSDGLEVLFN